MNREFWQGRRVLITGHTGFKGSWLSLWLQSLGAHAIGYSLPPPTDPNLFEAAGVAGGMISVIGDVRDIRHLHAVLEEHDPEIVFHMAAQPLVRRSYTHPIETLETNIIGTVNVLEGIRRCRSARSVVVVTSDKCYENAEWVWAYRENERLGGRDPYSCSKACAELVTASYRHSFFSHDKNIGVATARAGNVIGGGDWASDRLVPDAVRAALAGRDVFIRNPDAIRPWQHVLEPLAGYLALAEKLHRHGHAFSEGWNFGPAAEHFRTVFEVVSEVTRLWGGQVAVRVDTGRHPHEAGCLKLDSSKAGALLDWRPRLDLASTLKWTVDWYKTYGQSGNVTALTRRQIAEYMELAGVLAGSID